MLQTHAALPQSIATKNPSPKHGVHIARITLGAIWNLPWKETGSTLRNGTLPSPVLLTNSLPVQP